ncbi:MAG: DNA primase [Burkholderiales bacterium]|jgi:DNA primase|nr:DNA primase [Burkholderiales bacterium]
MIPPQFVQDLLARVDIVDVIDASVKLKRAGANYAACCPFHSEKSPSFTVSPTKQFYHCFGCGAHGTAISFLIEYHGLGFVEAVKELAQRVGMTVPAPTRRADGSPVDADDGRRAKAVAVGLKDALQQAARWYKQQLKGSPVAIDYLRGRGVSGDIAARFGLGYAPDGWQNLEAVFDDYAADTLVDAGLVIRNDEGRRYDRFRDRVMFPIVDARGDVVGFGGRVLGKGEPKYLNSPETPVFRKGDELYGLYQARAAIRAADRVLVVEGYMDVVALAQHGIANAVATLGTATTAMHVTRLLRLADEVTFCFDGDAAGRKAAWRALETALPALQDGKRVSFLFLPDGEDPDTFVRTHGKDAFDARLASAEPLSTVLLRGLQDGLDMATPEGQAAFLKGAERLLAGIQARNLGAAMREAVARAGGVTLAHVEAALPSPAGIAQARPGRGLAVREGTVQLRERLVLRSLVARPDLHAEAAEIAELAGGGGAWERVASLCERLRDGVLPAESAALLVCLEADGDHATAARVGGDLLRLGEAYDHAADLRGQLEAVRRETRQNRSRSLLSGVHSLADLTPEARALLSGLRSSR